VGTSMDTK